MAVKVCIWNVQNYGEPVSRAGRGKHGPGNERRNQFIATFVRQTQIDLLFLMEMFPTAGASLIDLLGALNSGGTTDWAFDLCGSCLRQAKPGPPTSENDLTYQGDGRSEGYAVFWRTNQAGRFRMVQGLHNIAEYHMWKANNPAPPAGNPPLSLVTAGRLTREDARRDRDGKRRMRVIGGCGPQDALPRNEQQQTLPDWPDLKFPTTGKSNPFSLATEKVRRPAYVVLKVKNGAGTWELCPVAAYHAPSFEEQAAWAPGVASLSREMYATNSEVNLEPQAAAFDHCNNTIMGGDFNYERSVDPSVYEGFTKALDTAPSGGAGCKSIPRPEDPEAQRKTTIRLLQGGVPIGGDDLDNYLGLEIDLAFYRPLRGISGERTNLLEILQQDSAVMGQPLYQAVLQATGEALKPFERRPFLLGPNGPQFNGRPVFTGNRGARFADYRVFRNQIRAGRLSDARQIAEFLQMFVSDHLPLTLTINI